MRDGLLEAEGGSVVPGVDRMALWLRDRMALCQLRCSGGCPSEYKPPVLGRSVLEVLDEVETGPGLIAVKPTGSLEFVTISSFMPGVECDQDGGVALSRH